MLRGSGIIEGEVGEQAVLRLAFIDDVFCVICYLQRECGVLERDCRSFSLDRRICKCFSCDWRF